MTPPITAEQVVEAAVAKYGDDAGAPEFSETYEAMQHMGKRKRGGVWYTPQPVAQGMVNMALTQALSRVGPAPNDVLRVVALEPCCGCGVFLVEAARWLAAQYAGRLFGEQPSAEQVMAVTPTVVLWCVYGIELDPVAAELSRIAVSRETAGVLTPAMLERHIIAGNTLEGASPPALEDRTGPQPELGVKGERRCVT